MGIYGYIRISSARQRIDRQMIDLQSLDVPIKSIFIDKKSGKDFNRPGYQALVKKLRRGDLLYIKSIDRLGRNADEVREQWRFLTQEKGVDIAVIDAPCLDTRIKNDVLCEFMNQILLYVMTFLAENEHTTIRKRQAEGIQAAKQRGVRFGRARKQLPENFMDYCELYLAHKLTVREAAELCGMAKSTFADAVKRAVQEGRVKKPENKSVNKENNVHKEDNKPKEKTTAESAPQKSDEKTALKSAEREKNRTKIFTFSPETLSVSVLRKKTKHKSASKRCKKSKKRKKTGRK